MKGVLPFYDNLNSLSDWFNWKICVSVVLRMQSNKRKTRSRLWLKGLFSVCSHDSAKITGHKSCESGGIFFSVCHMTSRSSRNHRVSKEDFHDKLTLSVFGGRWHCGSRDIILFSGWRATFYMLAKICRYQLYRTWHESSWGFMLRSAMRYCSLTPRATIEENTARCYWRLQRVPSEPPAWSQNRTKFNEHKSCDSGDVILWVRCVTEVTLVTLRVGASHKKLPLCFVWWP